MTKEKEPLAPRDLLYRVKSPFYCEDGVRLEFHLQPGVQGEKLFKIIIDGIHGNVFDYYLNGSLQPGKHSFSTIKKASPWEMRALQTKYNRTILLQERNHLPQHGQGVAFFYHTEATNTPPYLHLYEPVLFDLPRVCVVLEPWCYSLEETIEGIKKANSTRGRRLGFM
ncbi:hypothetical protein HYT55_03135 [Candidatus Woesearchaeota archaeon]|nr:hypothetical protein [Candidatus Woesearchaeota archaeon]